MPATISKSFIQTKDAALTDAYDGWLARIICYAFSVSYQALTMDVNRATAETAQEQAHQEGLAPLAQWVKGVMDRVLSQCLGWPDLEFAWATAADVDPLTQAQVNQIYLTTGVLTAAEVREGLGWQPTVVKFVKDGIWDEGNHPRVPAGCSDGGQFCSAGGLGRQQVAVNQVTSADDARGEAIARATTLATNNLLPSPAECMEEWEHAREICESLENSGKFGTDAYRGFGNSYGQCVRGHVSESCGGNAVAR